MLTQLIAAALQAGQAIMHIYTSPQTDWQIERKADNSPLTLADRESHRIIAARLADSHIPLLSEEGAHLPYESRQGWDQLWIVDPLDGTKEFIKRNGEFTVNIALVRRGTPVLGVIYAPATGRLWWGEHEKGAFTATVPAEAISPVDTPLTNEKAEEWARRLTQPGQAQPLPLAGATEGRPYRIVASRSHLSAETEAFINEVRHHHPDADTVSAGSSLKLCLVAEGRADVYPRLAPTMEWDTAAGHAIALSAGCTVTDATTGNPLTYNKPDLHNPFFIVRRS